MGRASYLISWTAWGQPGWTGYVKWGVDELMNGIDRWRNAVLEGA